MKDFPVIKFTLSASEKIECLEERVRSLEEEVQVLHRAVGQLTVGQEKTAHAQMVRQATSLDSFFAAWNL